MQFYPLPCYLVPLRPKCSPQHPILKHPQPTFLIQCQRPSFTRIKNNRLVLYILILYCQIPNWKTEDSAPNDSKHSLTTTATTENKSLCVCKSVIRVCQRSVFSSHINYTFFFLFSCPSELQINLKKMGIF